MKSNFASNRPTPDAPKTRPGLFQSLYARLNLLGLIILALLIGQTPFLSNLLSWQMTFFHEISHGLAALITGGRVLKIELHFSGAGLCYTSGGLRWFILLAGYAGAAFWGLLIYLLAEAFAKNLSHLLAAGLVAILAASGLLYARDFQSGTIIAIIAILYAAAVRHRDKLPLKLFLKLVGLYIILDAFKAPTALLRHRAINDAANLAGLTGTPEFFWIILWMAMAAGCLAFIWKIERHPGEGGRASREAEQQSP